MSEHGLYAKYRITKTSDGSEVENAFVLRPDRDRHAMAALTAYANSVELENPHFANELREWIREMCRAHLKRHVQDFDKPPNGV